MHRTISQFGVGIDATNAVMKSFRMNITEQHNLQTDSWEPAAQACCADSTAALCPSSKLIPAPSPTWKLLQTSKQQLNENGCKNRYNHYQPRQWLQLLFNFYLCFLVAKLLLKCDYVIARDNAHYLQADMPQLEVLATQIYVICLYKSMLLNFVI